MHNNKFDKYKDMVNAMYKDFAILKKCLNLESVWDSSSYTFGYKAHRIEDLIKRLEMLETHLNIKYQDECVEKLPKYIKLKRRKK